MEPGLNCKMKCKASISRRIAVGILLLAGGSVSAANRIISDELDSRILGFKKAYTLVLPEHMEPSAPVSVLVILHGLGRNEHTLIDDPETKEILLNAPFACLMPDGDGSWYINSPATPANHYADYLDEVIAHASAQYNLSTNASHRGICGWSMGGYGAMMTMLRRPDDFSAVATIIGLLDYPNSDLPKGQNFHVSEKTFGTDSNVWKTVNPFFQASELSGHPVLLIAGKRAFDWTMNNHFSDELKRLGIDHEWVVLPQGHTFAAVQEGLPLVIDFMKTNLLERVAE